MRIVFLTGIWPPDVGGPATHAPDLARFLRDRGHDVRVVTMGDAEPTDRPVPIRSVPRGRPFVVRYPLVAAYGARLARTADVVYATATYAAAAVAVTGAAASDASSPNSSRLADDDRDGDDDADSVGAVDTARLIGGRMRPLKTVLFRSSARMAVSNRVRSALSFRMSTTDETNRSSPRANSH